ncbi:CAP domain-containing protein [Euzebya tangerina]|uniref:CAP domain-containing protein n=1 Tax=Euzebya tangerina TaxID=591198 RepID=UPI000E3188C8|nr:CAP domain-containing protein [Euzebya tangerina]
MNTRLVLALVLSVLMILPATGVSAQTEFEEEAEQAFIDATNETRAEQGLAPLANNLLLREVARGWTEELVASGQLAHNPSYSQQYEGEWRRMGENVGYTSSAQDLLGAVERLHQAFVDSPGHFANITGEYNQMAVGVAFDDDGALWVTLNFLDGPTPSETPEEPVEEEPVEEPTPEPTPEPEPEPDFETQRPQEDDVERTHFIRG